MGLRGPIGRTRDEKIALGVRDRSTTIVTAPLRRMWTKTARNYDQVGARWLEKSEAAANLDDAERWAALAFKAHEISERFWLRLGRTQPSTKPTAPAVSRLSERPGA